jgi:hypothetical protein
MPETLRFDDLAPHLLLRNGNGLYKVPFRGGFAVLKVYAGSRSRLETWRKSFENVVIAGQTSYQPATRRRIELECLAWRRHGFRVYDTYDDVVVSAGLPARVLRALRVPHGPSSEVLRDAKLGADARLAVFRRFSPRGRRHELAIASPSRASCTDQRRQARARARRGLPQVRLRDDLAQPRARRRPGLARDRAACGSSRRACRAARLAAGGGRGRLSDDRCATPAPTPRRRARARPRCAAARASTSKYAVARRRARLDGT